LAARWSLRWARETVIVPEIVVVEEADPERAAAFCVHALDNPAVEDDRQRSRAPVSDLWGTVVADAPVQRHVALAGARRGC